MRVENGREVEGKYDMSWPEAIAMSVFYLCIFGFFCFLVYMESYK